ncbi:transcription termination factor 2 [Cylas formicarius]|uniref:transcription termination factor 2 n=1 Tax=Cylas formicarius TaxID=197179 RepID=UPI002958BEE9|nr:transcription termination factor 2 [Cylas formicarius]
MNSSDPYFTDDSDDSRSRDQFPERDDSNVIEDSASNNSKNNDSSKEDDIQLNGDESEYDIPSNTRLSSDFKLNNQGIFNSSVFDSQGFAHRQKLQTIHSDSDSSSSVDVCSDTEDIVEISSSENEPSPVKLPTVKEKLSGAKQQGNLLSFVTKKSEQKPQAINLRNENTVLIEKQSKMGFAKNPIIALPFSVNSTEYYTQTNKVKNLEEQVAKVANMLRTIKLDALPDKGDLLKLRYANIEKNLEAEREKLAKMIVIKSDPEGPVKPSVANWNDLKAGTEAVLPKTFGTQAVATYNSQRALTLEALHRLHGSLEKCPKENDYTEDPKGLKVSLMPHQQRALSWLIFRETQKPSGGILADDMGLGKTLTMISLILKSIETNKLDEDKKSDFMSKKNTFKGGTLVVCPASLLQQWSGEIERRLNRGLISHLIYHGPKRESSPKKLAEYSVVITTYSIVGIENIKESALFKIKWRRIILDEAHQIRNHKSQSSNAVCALKGISRWALTGTPLHNKELDMYALLKFLRCSPFNELPIWKRWVSDKTAGGQERLHTVVSSLMLRRTKSELMESGGLTCLPSKQWDVTRVSLEKEEMSVYHKILIFSQTLFAQFLHQRAEKNQDYFEEQMPQSSQSAPNAEYFKIRAKLLKMHKVKNVSQHEILVLLLRLRQICCHPLLITSMLKEDTDMGDDEDEESAELNLLEQLSNLNIDEDEDNDGVMHPSQNEKVSLKEASKGLLNSSHPIFSQQWKSSKEKAMFKLLKERVLKSSDKAIVVSQWTSYLNVIGFHLKEANIPYYQLDGKVPVNKRVLIVDKWNDTNDKVQVLLLSLTAGGVGLNLIGANHLFLLDLHWNPQLENQAQDRIYRVGQSKPVYVYKFLAADTIEERIKLLQDRKIQMADGMLSGTKQITQSKLSLQDLRMIFGM